MSYVQSYSASVPYSGSVSYGASQSGGTAHYSGSVPVHITIQVNTAPFDGSVDRCNTTIDLLNGAVVAMKAAQCAAISETSQKISNTLINGFFNVVDKEIGQQLVQLDSEVKSSFGLLQGQSKDVDKQRGVMETDYHRIASRYVTLFADLDEECRKRIYALDRPSFALAEKVSGALLGDAAKKDAASAFVAAAEEAVSETQLLVSTLRKKTREVISTLREYITQEGRMGALVASCLFNEKPKDKVTYLLPALWIEKDLLDGTDLAQETVVPACAGADAVAAALRDAFGNGGRGTFVTMEEGEFALLAKEFNALSEARFAGGEAGAETDEKSRRVYQTILALWNGMGVPKTARAGQEEA
ncbi:MAG: hypothetical protein LBR16_07220 [Treponema sp.]|jgi:hypothetical protein|nr:hypothetical protein [Treponema sp.]